MLFTATATDREYCEMRDLLKDNTEAYNFFILFVFYGVTIVVQIKFLPHKVIPHLRRGLECNKYVIKINFYDYDQAPLLFSRNATTTKYKLYNSLALVTRSTRRWAPGAILKPSLITRSTWGPLPRSRNAHLPRKVGICPHAMPIFYANFVPHECALCLLKKQHHLALIYYFCFLSTDEEAAVSKRIAIYIFFAQ